MRPLLFTLLLSLVTVCYSENKHLSLLDAVSLALMNEAQVEVLKLNYVKQEGALIASAEPFDIQLDALIDETYKHRAQNASIGIRSDIDAQETTGNFLLFKRTRLGTQFSLSGDTTLSNNGIDRLVALDKRGSIGTLSFRIDQPLLRNFRYSLDTMQECFERAFLRATFYYTLQSISERILDTHLQYWDLVASKELVNIQNESVQRNLKILEDSEELVRWQEVARSDLAQVRAQVAREKSRLAEARQTVIERSQGLSFFTGLGVELGGPLVLDLSLDAFPQDHATWANALPSIPSIVEGAIHTRFDLNGLQNQSSAVSYLVKGDCNAILPRLDLFAKAGSQNFQTGKSARTLPNAWSRNRDQVDLAMGLLFSMPLCNSGPKGRYRQDKAELCRLNLEYTRQRDLAVTEVRTTVSLNVTLAERIRLAEEEVEENSYLVDAELKKLKGGASNIFFVLDFQSRLTDSQRTLIELQRQYARNKALLLFQTGQLLKSDCCLNLSVHSSSLEM